jgi:type II secretory pathway pseudopilin PulG
VSDDSAPPAPPERPRIDVRLTVALAIAGVLVAAVVVVAVTRSRRGDRCGDLERQLAALSESMTLHRQAKGAARLAAIEDLEDLDLRCAKVSKAREVCAGAYREILLAEDAQSRARGAVKRIEEAVGGLDEPWRTAARRRVLENASFEAIAQELGVPPDQAEATVTEALLRLGQDRLAQLHDEFEQSLQLSDDHLKAGRERNEGCDQAFKRLLEEAQDR